MVSAQAMPKPDKEQKYTVKGQGRKVLPGNIYITTPHRLARIPRRQPYAVYD